MWWPASMLSCAAAQEYVNGIAMALVSSGAASDQPSARLTVLVEDISTLMKCVALHNAPLLHQHSCRHMDSGALAARDQLPPPGFYSRILVSSTSLI